MPAIGSVVLRSASHSGGTVGAGGTNGPGGFTVAVWDGGGAGVRGGGGPLGGWVGGWAGGRTFIVPRRGLQGRARGAVVLRLLPRGLEGVPAVACETVGN
jgi:hypothetical protein